MKFVLDSDTLDFSEAKEYYLFEGVMISDNEIYRSKYSQPSKSEIKNGVGQFCFVDVSYDSGNTNINIYTDFMGFYEVFYCYCSQDKRLIISNSFRALADYYRRKIGDLKLDTNYAVPLILSNYNFFNLPFSNRTAALQIKRIPADQNIVFNSTQGLKFEKKSFSGSKSDLTYEQLLEKGSESVKRKILKINELNVDKTLYMSGGKDSRATLASLTNAVSNKSFKVFSQDPSNFTGKSRDTIEKDLEITNKLCLLLSLDRTSNKTMKFKDKTYDLNESLDFESAYHQWMDDFSNIKYRCKFFNYKRIHNNEILSVEYHGLAGEVYRNYWSEYFQRFSSFDKKLEKNSNGSKRDLQKFFYTFVRTKTANLELYENAKRALISELDNIDGDNIYEKLNNHYGRFRNKYHFGIMLNKLKSGVLVFSPLIDKNYLLASTYQNEGDKGHGKLLFDIVDITNPYLNLIPFDSSGWSNHLKSRVITTQHSIALPDFIDMNEIYKDKLAVKFNNSARHTSTYNYAECAKNKIIESINFLGANEDSKLLFTDEVNSHLLNQINSSNIILSTVLGKVGSIMDVYVDTSITYDINPLCT